MARSLWSGSITFGLVNIPVKLFSAVSHKEVHFHMLHDEDGARIKQKRVCSLDGAEVPYEHIAKGYEVRPGQYVMIEPEELEKFDPKATHSIDIEDFVDLEEIDPIFFESTYYLAPDKGSGKPYALLLEAIRTTGKVGIARMVMRTKQYLCAVRPMGEGLALSTMLYADEVNSIDELEAIPKHQKPPERELGMAEQLVKSLSSKWEPDKYKDEYRDKVLELIHKKAEGEEIVATTPEPEPTKVVSLMDALRRSLEATKRGGHQAIEKEQLEAGAKEAGEETGERRHHAKAARKAHAPKKKTNHKPTRKNKTA